MKPRDGANHIRKMRLLPARRLATTTVSSSPRSVLILAAALLGVNEFLQFVLVDDLKALRQVIILEVKHHLDLDGHHVLRRRP